MTEKRIYRPVPELDEDDRREVFVNGNPREQADALLDIAMRGQDSDEIAFWIGMFLRDPDVGLRTCAILAIMHLVSRWRDLNWECLRRVLYSIANEDPDDRVRQSAVDIIDDVEHRLGISKHDLEEMD